MGDVVALTSTTERPSIVVLIMNVKGPTGTGNTPRQKRVIKKTILDTEPHVVLFQECNWTGTSEKTWLYSALPKHYEYFIHREASILIDTREVFATKIKKKYQILERLKSNPNNNLNVAFPLDFTPFPRMAMKRIKGLKQDLKDILVVSWHGVWTNTLAERKQNFEYLMEFLRQIGNELDLPLIVAGDFNIDFEDIVPLLPKSFKVAIYTASERRVKNGVKDHFIASKELRLIDVQSIDLDTVSENDGPTAVLDHEPVKCKVVWPSKHLSDDLDDEDWGEDTSELAVQQRLKELTDAAKIMAMNDDLEKSASERMDIFYKFVKKKINDGSLDSSYQEVIAEAERLDVKDKSALVLVELLLNEKVLTQIKHYRSLLLRFCRSNSKAQKYLLGGIEQLVGNVHKEILLPKVPHILKTFYDEDIVDEEVLIEWGSKVSKKYVSKAVAQEIHDKAAPFIKWLMEAEEEEESDGEDEVEVAFSTTEKVGSQVISPPTPAKAEPVEEEEGGDDIDIDAI